MALSHEAYDALIEKLEIYSKSNPPQYRLRVKWLAALGQIYIMTVVLLSLALTLGMGYVIVTGHVNAATIKIEIAFGLFTFALLASLWIKFPPPEGIVLSPQSAPRLFAMLEDLRAKLDCAPLYQILLTDEFNASAIQHPRFGVFGGFRNYVAVGMPLMQALSPDELRAVLAHELGHLSGNHSRFAGTTYRVRASWSNLMDNFRSKGGISELVFGKFFSWYAPYFSAYTFVLARQDEYEADRCAAEATSPKVASDALIRINLAAHYLDEHYWEEIYSKTDVLPKPDATPYAMMGRAFHDEMKPTDCERWLDRALMKRTDNSSTHPALSDRLSALGTLPKRDRKSFDITARPPLPEFPPVTAAAYYFGEGINTFLQRMDDTWKMNVAPVWEYRHKYAEEARKRLAGLDHRVAFGEILKEDEQWERIELIQEFRTNADSIPLLQQMVAEKPDHGRRLYALGVALLQEKQEAGIGLVEEAMRRETRGVLAGYNVIYDYLIENGKPEEAEVYRLRYLTHSELEDRADEETATITVKDTFASPELPTAEIATIAAMLASHPLVKEVYLVRKVLKTFPERKSYVIAWTPKLKWFQFSNADYVKENQEIAANTGSLEEAFFIVLTKERAKLKRKIQAIPGAKIV